MGKESISTEVVCHLNLDDNQMALLCFENNANYGYDREIFVLENILTEESKGESWKSHFQHLLG